MNGGHSFFSFEAVALDHQNYNCCQKKLTNKYTEKFVILQSIGIIVIKSSETRAVIYTCIHSIGNFNLYNSARTDFGIKVVH